MSYFFTSDTHFGHKNIIKYCKRPFKDVTEMDETLIANWNSVVKPEDVVYHLGDFALGHKIKPALSVIERLNGTKHLILGNHDRLARDIYYLRPMAWASMQHYTEICVNDQRIVLFHYPMRTWHHSYKGVWHLFGHTHNLVPSLGRSLDVGVDCWDYKPVSFEQLSTRMNSLSTTPHEKEKGNE